MNLASFSAPPGEQIIKAAASTSGAVTLPAERRIFLNRGTSQVVKQTTAGGLFTVGQVGNRG
jgi:hypothetical protein